MINSLDANKTKEMMLYVSEKIIENLDFLTEVDSKIGDGDHGIGMQIGFTKAKEALEKSNPETINQVFSLIGMSLIKSMGGASGVIFGTMFSGGVKGLDPITNLDIASLSTILDKSLQAIKERGKAQVGDKTMVDALEPAVISLKDSSNSSKGLLESLIEAENAANIGVENTKNYIAKFGRSKSLGERAIGYQDAGATSVWIIFKSMREWLERVG